MIAAAAIPRTYTPTGYTLANSSSIDYDYLLFLDWVCGSNSDRSFVKLLLCESFQNARAGDIVM